MRNKLKVCFVIDHLNVGGAGKLTIDVINGLSKDEFDISILCLYPIDNKKNLKFLIPEYIQTFLINLSKYNAFKKIIFLRNFFIKYDIVHSSLELSNFYCSLVKLFTPKRVKFIATIHGVGGIFIEDKILQDEIKKNWSWKYIFSIKYLQNFLFKFHDKFIAVCDYTKHFLINKRKVNKNKIQVVYHGINTKFYSKPVNKSEVQRIREELGIREQDYVMGYVGRLSHGKGLEYLLEAFLELSKVHNNFKLILVGDGILKEKLQNYIDFKSMKHKCIITGMVLSPLEYYNLFDLFVLPSFSETTSLTTLEAMYLKRISLTSNAGGLPEIINDGENGFLFEKGNFQEMKKKILYIYNNKDKLDAVKENAFNTVISKFNLNENVKKISMIFHDLHNH